MSKWEVFIICPQCEEKFSAAFDNEFHLHFTVCPYCGEPKRGWKKVTMKLVYYGTWWKPWTWLNRGWVSNVKGKK